VSSVSKRATPAQSKVIAGSDHWYKDAVIYEVHVRGFRDSDGDGMGDFRGLIEKLDYIAELGVTAIWLLPFYPSPLRDDGYDISDYRQVHPSYGTLRDFKNFLNAAHARGLKVITELVLNHTSDEHPWFQRARRAKPGSAHRDFYVWSDTPDRFSEARIIFTDYETSNWAYDQVAKQYYWHRFYSHQPSLNFDNPAVHEALFDVVDHWLQMGVDGLRLDAVPYLYAREGTSCENLPEVFEFLRALRRHVDERFSDRMLLAEANQWPEDAVAYLGDDDMCHMAFHFPLMPRMFMAARQEDRFPILDILSETPPAPPDSQWALFLRNHDELTLEMVTDEERDYMYRVYANDPQARVNVGIRRRLAPLLSGDRHLIQMMNGLLFSLPGTPILYYGDEIGMGDNIYLGDRNAVRTPMQWDSDRNAGFSSANPQRIYLPVIIDPEYHSQAVNVAAQEHNPSSLLWWMKRLISLRKRYRAFGRGTIELLLPSNRKVLAFMRRYEDELILVVVNLSRNVQYVELDLSELRGYRPVELFGNEEFPAIGDLPYFLTVGPHGFYWFSLEREPQRDRVSRPPITVRGDWDEVLEAGSADRLEEALAAFMSDRRWFGAKASTISRAAIDGSLAVPDRTSRARPRPAPAGIIVIARVDLDQGTSEQYVVPIAWATGSEAEELRRWRPDSVITDLTAGGKMGVLYDATYSQRFASALYDVIDRRRTLTGARSSASGLSYPPARRLRSEEAGQATPSLMGTEQSNTSIAFGDKAILKIIRRYEPGVSPAIELGRFLGERARFPHTPAVMGSLEYRASSPGAAPATPGTPAATIASLEQYVANEGDGWGYVVDLLTHGLEESLAHVGQEDLRMFHPPRLLETGDRDRASGHVLLGPHIEWASLLGRRTGELHVALASVDDDADFAPEPLTAMDRQAFYHGARSLTKRALRQASIAAPDSPVVAKVLARQGEIGDRLRSITRGQLRARKIRVHGDFHLGQVLWTGKDFVLIDFEGEPARSLAQRRQKRPAAIDLAGMIRSFHYASQAAARRLERDLGDSIGTGTLDQWLTLWYRWVSATFLGAYLEEVGPAGYLPEDRDELGVLLDFLLLEKAVYELGYEANSRPDWIDIPARGILDLLGAVR
jgi:maltose alpha-D-glucosyltransferase/alpha-amylase